MSEVFKTRVGFDAHVLAQEIAHHWTHPEEVAIAYQAAAEAIRRVTLAHAHLPGKDL